MSERADGGPAFPSGLLDVVADQVASPISEGMSLRDWFAGQALAGRMINGFASSSDRHIHARVAYEIADAMLALRKARGEAS